MPSKNPHFNHNAVPTSMFGCNEQASPISEGVTEIRINSHLAREITWQHDTRGPWRQHKWPLFVMTIKESGWVLPHPSAIFHMKTLMGSPWVARTLSLLSSVKWGKLSSNSATVELLSLRYPHKSHMRHYIINAYYNMAQLMQSLIDTRGGYHIRSSEYENMPLSPFPSGSHHFTLVAPLGLA
jgi:hypothetical protein